MKKSKPKTPVSPSRPDRRPISVRRWWGNGDSEATVKLTRPQWRRICAGEAVDASTWAWYEGKRERVGFRFNHSNRGDRFIGGYDCANYYHGTLAEAQITGADCNPAEGPHESVRRLRPSKIVSEFLMVAGDVLPAPWSSQVLPARSATN